MTRSLIKLVEMIHTGKLTATSLVEEACDNAVAHSELNAFISLHRKTALKAAQTIDRQLTKAGHRWPLAGTPLAVKDNIDVKGMNTTAGTLGINYPAKQSAPMVERLQKAGAIVIGKTNLHELAFGVTSNNAAFGAVRNPRDLACFPGGSSGGTAAAIAADIVPAGLGTDTAGSVRLPAALTGTVGLRPTTSRLSCEGVVPSVPAFDTIGPMAQSVADVIYLFEIITGSKLPQSTALNQLRLGIVHPLSDNLSPGVARAFQAALNKLGNAGVGFLEVDLSHIVDASFEVGFPIAFHQMKTAMTRFLAIQQPQTQFEELVAMIKSKDVKAVYRESVMGISAPSNVTYETALKRIPEIRSDYLRMMQKNALDALIFPTAVIEAQPIDTSSNTLELNGQKIPTLSAQHFGQFHAAIAP
ncbi:amidase family protein [Microbulbifer sp. OS29]|uniref:Amidase family protein n=1 Tax=Microbulbifer okhotskensis TaxID=2926617 RepID=A0A9X2EX53_9GAMM|nr:amidase family protein [Microbulbifer okhotskensis]MCO1336933.1 amidase family protein [Microbulbifer okhotskensis]